MKKTFFNVIVLAAVLIPCAALANKVERFSYADSRVFLADGSKRGHQLTFVPAEPGKDTGSWRITWKDGAKHIAELLIPGGIALPEFDKTLTVELDICCPHPANLLSADLRLLDAKGEICAMNSNRGGRYNGNLTAVWQISKDQTFKMAWGKNVNRKLDLPASISNIAFYVQHGKGEIEVADLRIISDIAR